MECNHVHLLSLTNPIDCCYKIQEKKKQQIVLTICAAKTSVCAIPELARQETNKNNEKKTHLID